MSEAIVTGYRKGSINPSVTLTNPGKNASAVALDASNNLYVAWYSLSAYTVEVDEYAPGSTSGTNLGLAIPAPSFPLYTMAFDRSGNLVVWYEFIDHSINYVATFPPGATKPSRIVKGGSLLDLASGIAFPRATDRIYLAAINVNEGDVLMYPSGLPVDVIGVSAAGVALSRGT
jgi:hypothetical protein